VTDPSARGSLLVISAPSGAGKTSLVKALLGRDPLARMSVSHTTRKRRPNETEGVDYFFVDREGFERIAARDGFLEHAKVFDNLYGTSREQVETLMAQGLRAILEIDWQGARQVRAAMPECRSVFVLPPSRAELERRLHARGTDSEAVVRRRLRDAVADMSHCHEFDYVIVNADFDRAVADLEAVVAGAGERLRADRPELQPLLAELLGS